MVKNSAHTKKMLAFFALLLAYIIWAAAGPVIKLTVASIPPFTFLFFRFLIVCVLLLPYSVYLLIREKIYKSDYVTLLLFGLSSQTAIILIFWGLKFTSALDASIIGIISPLLVIAAGHYFFNEKISKIAEIGILIATAGTLLVVIEPMITNHTTTYNTTLRILGNVLALMYSALWPIPIILGKKLMGKRSKKVTDVLHRAHVKSNRKGYSPKLITTLSFYVGLATLTPFAYLESMGKFGPYPKAHEIFTRTSISGLLYMAILSSIVAYLLFHWAIKYTEASETALFSYLGPVFTLPFAYLLLSEIPTTAAIAGSAVIAVGVVIAEKYKS